MSEAGTFQPGTGTVRLGIIGAGIMGERLLRAAAGQDRVQVAGLWDPAPEAVARLGAELPGTPFLRSAAAVIEAADCVYVASPPATHLPHARAALKAGKALFCEKPLAVDVADAGRFLREAHALPGAGGARAAVNFPFASSPTVERLGEWLAGGAIGQVESLAIAADFARWPRGWQHAAAGWLDGPAQGDVPVDGAQPGGVGFEGLLVHHGLGQIGSPVVGGGLGGVGAESPAKAHVAVPVLEHVAAVGESLIAAKAHSNR